MAASYDPTDPRHLTPQQRLDAVAALLAASATRALLLRGAAPAAPVGPSDSSQNPVDVPGGMRLHVPRS